MHHGQASLEYIFLVGFSLVVVSVLWTLSGSNIEDTSWELNLAYAESALQRVVRAADDAYVQGPPAQTYVGIDMPEGVRNVYIENNTVTFELVWKGFLRNVTDYSVTNITGYINTGRGRHRLLVRAGNPVNITEA